MQLIGVADTCANFLVIQKHSKQIERQHHNTTKNQIYNHSTEDSRNKAAAREDQKVSNASPSHQNQVHPSVYSGHKNSRMQVEEEEHLPPSAISLNQPFAGPRNLLLNSAQPSLVRLNFYKFLFLYSSTYFADRALKREIARWWVASRPCHRGFFMTEVGFQCGSGVCFVQNRPNISTSLRQTILHEHGFQVTGNGFSSLRTQTANFLRLRRK